MKILVVDDHALFRAGLRLLLAGMESRAAVYEAATLGEATALAAEHPDLSVCLLDLTLARERGLDALTAFKAAAPDVAVVIVSATSDLATVHACIDAGAMSFVPKSMPPATLTQALQRVLAGQIHLPEEVLSTVAVAPRRPALSPRELDVLRGLARALPTKTIARELRLSEYTVKEYIRGLFEALDVHNRTEAVITAGRLGLLDLPRPS
ncbi:MULTISPECIES: response regulator transcription factor [unclassified Variovorax]|jgi:two-component system nitrate/nitrite response regulator NarL|uniref:response regulator n=1 Tax=unclassified Variovorax TaxID=663243 RepID=UPI0008E8C148|nr:MULTISPECIES: response regulator transcription factor [unclassified Variovorax]KAF1072399.1 MAG: Transcriptional activator protein ExaE [Variovorax sp.]SFO09884.1 two component transcriptional regulator, LuxR family [Variovorax sp. PDC80]